MNRRRPRPKTQRASGGGCHVAARAAKVAARAGSARGRRR
eukprot:COSAG06_NODE_253_length_19061_cov_33.083114_15_plen_40_part_00